MADEQTGVVVGGRAGDRAGWAAPIVRVRTADPSSIVDRLRGFVPGASTEQINAWRDSIRILSRELGHILDSDPGAAAYSGILEYLLFLDERRADVVLLVAGPILVLEMKGHSSATQAALDQVAAYARDIAAYHRDAAERPVHAVLVPTRMRGELRRTDEGVWIVAPDRVAEFVRQVSGPSGPRPPELERFLDVEAYRPLPTLVEAARQIFHTGKVAPVWRASARTDAPVRYIEQAAVEASSSGKQHLVLVTGVPGAGKTLVGLRLAHTAVFDSLATSRRRTTPTAPALFLSGNGPLVEVLQYAFRDAGAAGKTFVRHIKSYLDMYVPSPGREPAEHVLIFDEAQRAFSADMVREKHPKWGGDLIASEPELFVRLCDRMPGWGMLVGLIGSGQEIHVGEEGGVLQWRDAIERCRDTRAWVVHAPPLVAAKFEGCGAEVRSSLELNLDFSLRFHLAEQLHRLVADLLEPSKRDAALLRAAERELSIDTTIRGGLRLWVTRDLDAARHYLRQRYEGQPGARYGLIASSRDRDLPRFGVDNSWNATRVARLGPWFMDDPSSPSSCCALATCLTEFQVQGLELDMSLMAWGTDLRRVQGTWSNDSARGYRTGGVKLHDPMRLRVNAYRVLLTRGRDGTVVFVPPIRTLDETFEYLVSRGFRPLPKEPVAGTG